jgi:indole-3-glycerol phosphate synthase
LNHIEKRVDVVGVNNRNLKTFEVNLDTSVHLSKLIPEHQIKITESGIRTVEDVLYLRQFGYKGFLIGENFMKTQDPGLTFMKFASELYNQI